jgi:predicted NodU family carbamoyl transferase
MGPVLYNLHMNDLYYVIEECDMFNYADDNSLSYQHENQDVFVTTLQKDAGNCLECYEENHMKANPDKFQGIMFGNRIENVSFKVKDVRL